LVKICLKCLEEKNIFEFELRTDTQKYRNSCKKCRSIYCAEWYQKSGNIIKSKNIKYKENNKIKLQEDNRIYYNKKYKNNPEYRLRKIISLTIRNGLKLNKSSKYKNSILQFLPYTFSELKQHIESLFEAWMTWENHGKYISKNWKDDNPHTWTWQIDHIMPQSDFPYSSMTDDNFQKCWDLNNLRPYSAKQNQLDGASKIRHRNYK
jgi:hypothetical protein